MLTLLSIIFLGVLSICDLRTRSVPLALLGLGALILGGLGLWEHGLWTVLAGCVPGAALLVIALLRPQSLGTGDGLTVMIAGGAMGLAEGVVWILCGFGLAGIAGIWRLLIKKDNPREQMPLLPFLFLAAVWRALL